MATPIRLDPAYRAQAWRRLAEREFDVLIVGGGVTGGGAALDAATRGLSVALVEQRDFASGTSSRSSKLMHGGLRYLEQFDFGLVREALRERELAMTRLAPHLVKPVSFLYPLKHRACEPACTAVPGAESTKARATEPRAGLPLSVGSSRACKAAWSACRTALASGCVDVKAADPAVEKDGVPGAANAGANEG